MSDNPTVIVYAKRTPIGKFNGGLASVPAPELSAAIIKDALEQTGVKGEEIDEVIVGNVLTAGIGQAPARQAALKGGLPTSVCATTIGRVCGSGLKSLMLADQSIRLGDAKIIFTGGQESMSLAPHLLPNSRGGYRFGNFQVIDSMQYDGLWDPYDNMAMGNCGEICAKEYGFSREDQDKFALTSYERSRRATESGLFKDEIVAIDVAHRKGVTRIDQDEEPFSVDLEKVTQLRPAFEKNGTVTAANASSINDGSAMLLVTDLKTAQSKGWEPLAKIVGQASYAQDPQWFTTAPVGCIKKLLEKTNLNTHDVDLWEINEAFAVVPMAAMRDLDLDIEKVNVNGGAVSLGHPIGASGARIMVTLVHAMKKRGAKRGVAAICIGGGEASAVMIEAI